MIRTLLNPVRYRVLRILLIVFGVNAWASAVAASPESVSCAGSPLVEAYSIAAVPREAATLLGYGQTGSDGLADRGSKFNVTDVVDPNLPMQRFTFAGVSAICVIALIEHGGRGHWFEVVDLRYVSKRWLVHAHAPISSVPRSLNELGSR